MADHGVWGVASNGVVSAVMPSIGLMYCGDCSQLAQRMIKKATVITGQSNGCSLASAVCHAVSQPRISLASAVSHAVSLTDVREAQGSQNGVRHSVQQHITCGKVITLRGCCINIA